MTDEETAANRPNAGRVRQKEIFVRGLGGERPMVPTDMERLEGAARAEMSKEAFAYVAGGAGTESTILENREAFERRRIVPRMLRDVSQTDPSVELFGQTLPSPFLLAPIGVLEMAHERAGLAAGEACAEEDVPFIISSQASYSTEDIADAMDEAGGGPRWFQLYWSESDELVESFVRRAEDAGCEALVVTLDTTLLGWRPRDLDLAYLPFLRGKGIAQYTSDPVFQELLEADGSNQEGGDELRDEATINLQTLRALMEIKGAYPGGFFENLSSDEPLEAVKKFINTYSRPSLSWDDLSFVRELTDLPIVLKGVLHPEDAEEAVERDMDGVIVSNHGGRQVDGAIGALDALPGVVDAVDGELPVLFDSGIRTGADAFKALALGAEAVCLGRPYCYALALGGREGVRTLIRNFKADFELTMALSGVRSVGEIGEGAVRERG